MLKLNSNDRRLVPPTVSFLRAVSQDYKPVNDYYERYKNGNCTRDEMLESCYPHLRYVVARLLGKYTYLVNVEDDLANQGVLILMRIIEDWSIDDFERTMTSRLISGIVGYANELTTVTGTSSTTIRWCHTRGRTFPTADQTTKPDTLLAKEQEEAIVDLYDAVAHLCESELDSDILTMFHTGETIREVADRHGLVLNTVRRRRNVLYNKLKERLQNE